MDQGRTDRRLTDSGVSSLQFLLASGLGLILFITFANLIVVQYGRGAVNSALDQGVRVASITGSAVACEQRVDLVLGELLGGAMGRSVSARCEIRAGLAVATATAEFQSWTPLTAAFRFEANAFAAMESP